MEITCTEVRWLGEPGCEDPATVGGKAAALAALAARAPVPAGFCVVPAGAPEGAGPAAAGAYEELGRRTGVREPAVAVRSSGIDEDGVSASFAGQHATWLNVRGAEAVAAAAVACTRSGATEAALAYRRARGLDAPDRPLPVLVQRLVVADVCGVVFSADPLSGERGRVVVDATWGLGESLVGGTVTPDSWTVDAVAMTVVSRRVSAKRRMTVAVPGGTEEVDVPRVLREAPALSDGAVLAAAALALDLEAVTGRPVDVECAWDAAGLHLLQCRPITTILEESTR